MDNLPSNVPGHSLPPAIRSTPLRAPAQLAVKLSIPAVVLILLSGLIAAAVMYLAARHHILDIAARNAEQRAASSALSLSATHDRAIAHMQALMSEPIHRYLDPNPRTERALSELFSRHIREHPEIIGIILADTNGTIITDRLKRRIGAQDLSFLSESPPVLPRTVLTHGGGESTLLLTSPVYRDETTLAAHVVMVMHAPTLFSDAMHSFVSSTEHPDPANCDTACHSESELLNIGFPLIATGTGVPLGAPESLSVKTTTLIAARAAKHSAPDTTTLIDIPGFGPGLRAAVRGADLQGFSAIAVVLDRTDRHLGTLNRTWFVIVGLACLSTLILSVSYLFVIEHLIAPIRRVVLHAHHVAAGSDWELSGDTGLKEADEMLWALRQLSSRTTPLAGSTVPELGVMEELSFGTDVLLDAIESTTELAVNLTVRLQGLTSLKDLDHHEMNGPEMQTALQRLGEDISRIHDSADKTATAAVRIADDIARSGIMDHERDLHPRVMDLLCSVDHVTDGTEALKRRLDAAMSAISDHTTNETLAAEIEHMHSIAERIFDTIVFSADEICRLSADIQHLAYPEGDRT